MPSSHLILVYQKGTSLEENPTIELFIPQAEPADLMWSVPPPSLKEADELYSVSRIAHTPALLGSLMTFTEAFPDAIIHSLPQSNLFPVINEDILSVFKKRSNTNAYLLSALHKARLIKTEFEIASIRKANEISSRAHEVIMRLLGQAVSGRIQRAPGAGIQRPLLPGEWLIEKEAEAEAVFVASCRREG